VAPARQPGSEIVRLFDDFAPPLWHRRFAFAFTRRMPRAVSTDDGKICRRILPILRVWKTRPSSIREPRKYGDAWATEAPRHRRLPAGIPGQPFWGASRLRVFIDFDYPATFAGKLARSAIWPDLRLLARQPDCQFPSLPRYNVEQSSSASPTG
jgi:hypothetical protein